jgi:predicted transglutaminase-like cysteine proteinase
MLSFLLAATVALVPFGNRQMEVRLSPIISEIKSSPPIVHKDSLVQLVAINRAINESITYDPSKNDWRTPSMLKGLGKGNCKDYVVLKMAALYKAGFSLDDMKILIVALPNNALHAVLVVKTEHKSWVLDNRVSVVRAESEMKDYTPLISYSTQGNYLFGTKKGL